MRAGLIRERNEARAKRDELAKALQSLLNGIDTGAVRIESDEDERLEFTMRACRAAVSAASPITIVRPATGFAKHWPLPWRFEEEGYSGGPCVKDASSSVIAALFWPTHPPEETAEAEQETYALGRAIAALATDLTNTDRAELVELLRDLDDVMDGFEDGAETQRDIRKWIGRLALAKVSAP